VSLELIISVRRGSSFITILRVAMFGTVPEGLTLMTLSTSTFDAVGLATRCLWTSTELKKVFGI